MKLTIITSQTAVVSTFRSSQKAANTQSLPAVNAAEEPVDEAVGLEPSVILPQVFDGRDQKHQSDGGQRDLRLEGLHHRNKVKSGQEDEVDVGKAMKLLEQILGQKGEQRILGGPDLVATVRLQEFNQLLVVCGKGDHRPPLPPQVIFDRMLSGRKLQATHESSSPADSDQLSSQNVLSASRQLGYLKLLCNPTASPRTPFILTFRKNLSFPVMCADMETG